MQTNEDSDRTAADTERAPAMRAYPVAPRVWLFADHDDQDPRMCGSLIEATGEPPSTPEAEVYYGGKLLAQAADDVAGWKFTRQGAERIEQEAHGAVERDRDVALSILLREDLEAAE